MSDTNVERYEVGTVVVGADVREGEVMYTAATCGVKVSSPRISSALIGLAQALMETGEEMDHPMADKEVKAPPAANEPAFAPTVMSSGELRETFRVTAINAYMERFASGDDDATSHQTADAVPELIAFCASSMRSLIRSRLEHPEAPLSPLYLIGGELLTRLGFTTIGDMRGYARSFIDDVAGALPLPETKTPTEMQ